LPEKTLLILLVSTTGKLLACRVIRAAYWLYSSNYIQSPADFY